MIRVTIEFYTHGHHTEVTHESEIDSSSLAVKNLSQSAARELVRAVWGAEAEQRIFER